MRKIMGLILIASLLFISGCSEKKENSTVSSGDVVERPVTVDTFGIVKAKDVKDIYLDFPAFVEDIPVKNGQKVNKGDVLLIMNYDEFNSQINSTEAEINSIKLEMENNQLEMKNSQLILEKLKKDLKELQDYLKNNNHPDLKLLMSDLENARKAYDDSLKDLKTQQELFKAGTVSKEQLEMYERNAEKSRKSVNDIETAIEKTKYNLQKEIENLELTINQNSVKMDGYENAKAICEDKIKSLESKIELMKRKIDKSYIKDNTIISDIEKAIVYDINYVKGENINTTKKVLSIVDLDSVIIEADVPEEFIKDVKIDSKVKIVPQADKSKEYSGKVTYISNTAKEKNGETAIPVEIYIEDYDGFLKPNFNVNLEISID